jgi:hypothetical protein
LPLYELFGPIPIGVEPTWDRTLTPDTERRFCLWREAEVAVATAESIRAEADYERGAPAFGAKPWSASARSRPK